MSIDKNQPTEPVETTDSNSGELSKDEADQAAGGILRKKTHWEGGHGRHGGYSGGDGGDGGDSPVLKSV